jgi:hypothetical protein
MFDGTSCARSSGKDQCDAACQQFETFDFGRRLGAREDPSKKRALPRDSAAPPVRRRDLEGC